MFIERSRTDSILTRKKRITQTDLFSSILQIKIKISSIIRILLHANLRKTPNSVLLTYSKVTRYTFSFGGPHKMTWKTESVECERQLF